MSSFCSNVTYSRKPSLLCSLFTLLIKHVIHSHFFRFQGIFIDPPLCTVFCTIYRFCARTNMILSLWACSPSWERGFGGGENIGNTSSKKVAQASCEAQMKIQRSWILSCIFKGEPEGWVWGMKVQGKDMCRPPEHLVFYCCISYHPASLLALWELHDSLICSQPCNPYPFLCTHHVLVKQNRSTMAHT